jgi:hypothetical protein
MRHFGKGAEHSLGLIRSHLFVYYSVKHCVAGFTSYPAVIIQSCIILGHL